MTRLWAFLIRSPFWGLYIVATIVTGIADSTAVSLASQMFTPWPVWPLVIRYAIMFNIGVAAYAISIFFGNLAGNRNMIGQSLTWLLVVALGVSSSMASKSS